VADCCMHVMEKMVAPGGEMAASSCNFVVAWK